MTTAHSSTSFAPATTQTHQTSSLSVAITLSLSCLSCVSPICSTPASLFTLARVLVIDQHVRRHSRLLSSRFPHHRPSLVPTRRFSLFIRSMAHRVKIFRQRMSYRVLILFAGSRLHPPTLVYTYSQKHQTLKSIFSLLVAG